MSAFHITALVLLAVIAWNSYRCARRAMGLGNPRIDRLIWWAIRDTVNSIRPRTL